MCAKFAKYGTFFIEAATSTENDKQILRITDTDEFYKYHGGNKLVQTLIGLVKSKKTTVLYLSPMGRKLLGMEGHFEPEGVKFESRVRIAGLGFARYVHGLEFMAMKPGAHLYIKSSVDLPSRIDIDENNLLEKVDLPLHFLLAGKSAISSSKPVEFYYDDERRLRGVNGLVQEKKNFRPKRAALFAVGYRRFS